MRRLLSVLLALAVLIPGCAAAEPGCCQADPSAADEVTTADSFLRVVCPAEDTVMLTVTDSAGAVCYARYEAGTGSRFQSEEIYLPLMGGNTDYFVTVATGEHIWRLTVHRTQAAVKDVTASAAGYPMAAGPVTLLDTAALAGAPVTVDLIAGIYRLGTVTYTLGPEGLTAEAVLFPEAGAEVSAATVQVALNAADASRLGRNPDIGRWGVPGEPIPLDGAPYCAVDVRLTVSFDPTALENGDPGPLEGQEDLWLEFDAFTQSQAVG